MATNEIYLHSCWYGSFSVTVPMGCSLVVEWGDGGVEHRVSWRGWEFFSRHYPCEDSIYGDNAVYCTHVYAKDDAPILEFSCGSDLKNNKRVDTSHCPSLLELSCTVEESPDLSGNPLLKKLNCDSSRFEVLDSGVGSLVVQGLSKSDEAEPFPQCSFARIGYFLFWSEKIGSEQPFLLATGELSILPS